MRKIGLIGLGDMGGAVGRSLVAAGHDVRSVFSGRGDESMARAKAGGIKDAVTLDGLMKDVEIILSIVPPGVAQDIVRDLADEMEGVKPDFLFVDLNAVAPATSKVMEHEIVYAGGTYLDGSIIGAAPYKTKGKTRFYVSGRGAAELSCLSTDEIDVRVCGYEVGQASGLKMAYAGLTKGTMTLHTAVMLAAQQMGLAEPLTQELRESQGAALNAMERSVPFIAADSVRWADEMDEIAKSFSDVGVTPKFHEGAGDIFRLLATTPLEAETRATADYSRDLNAALEIYGSHIGKKRR